MKRFLLLVIFAAACYGADWDALRRTANDRKIEITTQDGTRTRATFVSSTGESLVVRETSGEHSFARADVHEVRVYDPSRRWRRGLIWTAVGLGAGIGVGFAVCPYCANEGHGDKFVGPGAAIGAGLGALGFFTSSYRTVYKRR